MLQSYDGISDLNFSVGRPLQVEAFGQLKPIAVDPPIDSLTVLPDREHRAQHHGQQPAAHPTTCSKPGSCDCGYQLGTQARFRVNIFRQQGRISVVMRKLNSVIPSLDSLGLPHIFAQPFAGRKRGSCSSRVPPARVRRPRSPPCSTRSTARRPIHIVTLEDPVEFVHPAQSEHVQPARTGHGFQHVSQRPARRVAASAEGDPRRRNARPRDGRNRHDRRRDGSPRAEHPAHDRRRPVHQPHPRPVRPGRGKT